MNEIVYTLATENDMNDLVLSRIEFLTGLCGEQDASTTQLLHEHLVSYFGQAIPTKEYIGLMAKSGNKVVATGGMVFRLQPGSFKNPSGRTAYILNMYTLPSFRRKGIGTHILTQLMTVAGEMDIHAFELHATAEGAPVYEQCGFEQHHEPTYRKYTSGLSKP